MANSIFWYDFETTGVNPRTDRPLQVAGIRTDLALNVIEPPVNFYCQLPEDILPHPQACLITGITPDILASKGLSEVAFFNKLEAELARPQTCGAGYNSIRFDDEVTRYGLYRNFFDPYAREWQGGNSRWDIIDLLRTVYALRPEGIVWPEVEGQVSLKLELLTGQNGIEHAKAHDALSDVRATIALAKFIRGKQAKLYDYLFQLRVKQQVQSKIALLKPIIHVSGRFSAERHYLSVVLPLAWHPTNRNALIVCDLQKDVSPLLALSAQQITEYLYTRHEALPANVLPIPLKLIHVNRCPVIAPLGVLREQDSERLQLDLVSCLQKVQVLTEQQAVWQDKLTAVYQALLGEFKHLVDDPEQQLYAGFLSARDKKLCERIRGLAPAKLVGEMGHFEDERLDTLLFRYRARNYNETLTQEEQLQWQQFCCNRLTDLQYGAPLTVQQFLESYQALLMQSDVEEQQILQKWQDYVVDLQNKYLVRVE